MSQEKAFNLVRVRLLGDLTQRRCRSIRSRLSHELHVDLQTVQPRPGDVSGSIFFIEQDPEVRNPLTLDELQAALQEVLRNPVYRKNDVTAEIEVLGVVEGREVGGDFYPSEAEADAAIAAGEVSDPVRAEEVIAALHREVEDDASTGGTTGAFAGDGVLEPAAGGEPNTGDGAGGQDFLPHRLGNTSGTGG